MRKHFTLCVALVLSMTCVACDGGTSSDKTPPGEVTGLTAGVVEEQVVLDWTDPTDSDLAEIEITYIPGGSGRTLVMPGTETYAFGGLTDETSYTFTLRTIDESDNVSTGVSTSWTTDGVPPVPGASGALTSTTVAGYYFGLAWTRATDNMSAQSALEYRVYYRYSTDIGNTVTAIEANGTPVGDWQTDIGQIGFNPPSEGSCWFNVVVRDEQGYKAAYTSDRWIFVF